MNAKTNLILLAVAVGLTVVIFLGGNPFASRVGTEVDRKTLFPGLSAATPAKVTLSKGESSVTLRKEGDDWLLASMQDHPANGRQVVDLLEHLRTSFKAESPAARQASAHAGMGVTDELGTHIVVEDDGGKVVADLIVGETKGLPDELIAQIKQQGVSGFDTSQKPHTYFRKPGDDTVWTAWVNVAGSVNAQPDRWIERRVVSVELKDVVKVEVQRGDDTLVLERTSDMGTPEVPHDDAWVVAGDPSLPAMQNIVSSIANRVGSASITALVTEEGVQTGLDAPRAVATITTAAGETATIRVGAPTDLAAEQPTLYYLQVEGKPFVYTVNSATFTDLSKPREEIVKRELTSYQVRSADRILITDGSGDEALTYVFEKQGTEWDAEWKIVSPEGLETDRDAIGPLLEGLLPSEEKKLEGYVLDGSSWEPGPKSRTFQIQPHSWDEQKPTPVETVTFGGPESGLDGQIRVRVAGRSPDAWVEADKFETVMQPIETWAWKPAPPEEAVPDEGAPEDGGEGDEDQEPATQPADPGPKDDGSDK